MKIINNKVFFYTNYFSNFHRCRFVDPNTNVEFSTTEQAFMWYKARFFNDTVSREALEEFGLHPREAKNLGRLVKNYNETQWECVRFGYMVYVNYLKFTQNQDVKAKLIDTDDKILAEASPNDLIWGIGLAENEEDYVLSDITNWTGRNLLGRALMKVRTLIKN